MVSENKDLILRICRIYCNANSYFTIDDLYQEIVLNMWKGYPRYLHNRRCKASTWLYKVAINTALFYHRKQKKTHFSTLEPKNDSLPDPGNEDKMTIRLYGLIDMLNDEEKTIVALYLENLPQNEIAEIIGISATNVSTKIQRIKLKLKRLNERTEQ